MLRLDRVLDSADVEARLAYPLEVVIAPCPKAEFVPDDISRGNNIRCATPGVISGYKVPPLAKTSISTLTYLEFHPSASGGMKTSMGDGSTLLSKASYATRPPASPMSPRSFKYPSPTTTQTITVLRRPSVSFKTCGPGRLSSLLIGSETLRAAITPHSSDPLDGLWDAKVRYSPSDKMHKAWEKQLKTQDSTKDIILHASAPGEYTILGVKGNYCDGNVLSPETCKVIEMPLPGAEIEWKKIHEW